MFFCLYVFMSNLISPTIHNTKLCLYVFLSNLISPTTHNSKLCLYVFLSYRISPTTPLKISLSVSTAPSKKILRRK